MRLAGGEIVAIAGDALVGHQMDDVTAPAQFLRQRHRREEMPSRTARHQHDHTHSAGATTALR